MVPERKTLDNLPIRSREIHGKLRELGPSSLRDMAYVVILDRATIRKHLEILKEEGYVREDHVRDSRPGKYYRAI